MSTLKNLIKIAAMGAVVYGAYKYGKSVGDKSIQPEKKENPFPELTKYPFVEVDETEAEIQQVTELIQELRTKPNKTQKDRYNIELLEVKLKQLKSKK
jgi:hypothetical protein